MNNRMSLSDHAVAPPQPDFENLRIAELPGPKSSILDTVGRTPVVRLNTLSPGNSSIFAKLEAFNPLGSIKDRLALAVIEDAEDTGALHPGQTVVEATSGNTGIGLAMVCAQKGYPLVVVMAENFSVERRRLMRFMGARVVLTPASAMGTGMLQKAEELAGKHGWFLANQFSNPANAETHAHTTAVEILSDFQNGQIDYFITGFGTGGTLRGVGETLRQHSPATQIVVAEPDNAPMLASGVGNGDQVGTSHPRFRPHPMQGWSPDFLSRFALEARDLDIVDQFLGVSGVEAIKAARNLATQEGILAGITGGATVAAALQVAKTAPDGATILAMVPDTGERYMSTPLFDGIDADMTAQEEAISRSTPGYRFDVSANKDSLATPKPVAVDADAARFIETTIADATAPIVIFALEWCEFCWSVRRLFSALDVPVMSVNLDAASFEGGQEFATKIRAALSDRTGARTIPQVFVNGEHVGGATETFDAYNTGALHGMIAETEHVPKSVNLENAYELLPSWLHKR